MISSSDLQIHQFFHTVDVGQSFQVLLHFHFYYKQEDKEKNARSSNDVRIQLFPSNNKLY